MQHRRPYILPARRGRRGFTFTEVMFAVILLGIGFIMLAAMFPVAIRQTQTTADESYGANLAQAGAKYLETVAIGQEYLETGGEIRGLSKEAWLRLDGNIVNSQDPRWAWTALYKRNPGENFIQVVILAARSNLKPVFDANDTSALNMPLPANPGLEVPNLYPRRLGSASIKKGDPVNGVADRITFSQVEPMLGSGTFIVCGSNNNPVRVYRLGNEFERGKDYDLDPAYGLEPNDPATVNESVVWALGMAETAPGSKAYDGLTMDVAAYVTFVMLK